MSWAPLRLPVEDDELADHVGEVAHAWHCWEYNGVRGDPTHSFCGIPWDGQPVQDEPNPNRPACPVCAECVTWERQP